MNPSSWCTWRRPMSPGFAPRTFIQDACAEMRACRCSRSCPARRHLHCRPPPPRRKAMVRESTGRPRRDVPYIASRFATTRLRAATPCRARRWTMRGGPGRSTMPATGTRPRAAIGSSGSIQSAIKYPSPEPARTRPVRCLPGPCAPQNPTHRTVSPASRAANRLTSPLRPGSRMAHADPTRARRWRRRLLHRTWRRPAPAASRSAIVAAGCGSRPWSRRRGTTACARRPPARRG